MSQSICNICLSKVSSGLADQQRYTQECYLHKVKKKDIWKTKIYNISIIEQFVIVHHFILKEWKWKLP